MHVIAMAETIIGNVILYVYRRSCPQVHQGQWLLLRLSQGIWWCQRPERREITWLFFCGIGDDILDSFMREYKKNIKK